MAQGRSSSISSGILLTELDMLKLISLLTQNLADIEKVMVAAWRAGKTKISSALSHSYLLSTNELVSRLRDIASALFNETEISKIKPYRENDKTPENFNKYLRVSDNITKLVIQDILYQPDVDHAVAAFDRWLYICKIAFHQHDFFTSTCILTGLSAESVNLSKIENELSQTSVILVQYYQNLLEKSAPLYAKQEELLKYKLDIIPTLRALTSMYVQLDPLPPKGKKHTKDHITEITVQRRAVSKNFASVQKMKRPELSEEDNLILNALYKKFDEQFTTVTDDHDNQKNVSNFEIRSKTLRSLVNTLKTSAKLVSTSNPFSVATFSKLVDDRVQLITIHASIENLQGKYDPPTSDILDKVKLILRTVGFTDRVMRHKINDAFELAGVKLDKKIKKLHKDINSILIALIKKEEVNGKKTVKDKPEEIVSSEETKKPAYVEKSSSKLNEISSSRAATEEKYSPKVNRRLDKKISSLSEAESESSINRSKLIAQLQAQQTDSSEKNPPVVESPQIAPQKIEPQEVDVKTTEAPEAKSPTVDLPPPAVPDNSSSFRILIGLKQPGTPRDTDSPPSSVRTEIEDLLTARSVKQGKKAYEEVVVKSGGSLFQQPIPLISPRVPRARSNSSTTFFISKPQGGGSSGSLTARAAGSLKESALDSVAGGVGVKRPEQ